MNADFYFENLDEFRAKLDGIAGAYTETTEKHLKRAGNKLRKLAAENTPVSGVERTSRKGKKVKPLHKSWKGKVTGLSTDEIQYELRNTSKVYHLVERGHVMKNRRGEVVGFVGGRHFFDRTLQAFEQSDALREELEKFMQEMKKKFEQGG